MLKNDRHKRSPASSGAGKLYPRLESVRLMRSPRTFFISVFVFAIQTGFASLATFGTTPHETPNIIVLFADDAGYADFGFQPDCRDDMRSLTPRIDSIAKEGCRFTNAYMSGQVCSPSRAGLMTGRYQQRFGHDNNIPPGYMKGGLPLSETFVSKRLQAAGYTTGLVGKWHLGYPEAYHPNRRGFDFFYGCLQGSRSYFPMAKPTPHRVFLENQKATPEGGYTTDRIGDAACRFILDNQTKPFFLFASFTAPHGPLQAKPEILKELQHIEKQRRRKYAGLVVSLDQNVGKILDCLKSCQLERNTIVVFTNDNGGQTQTGADNFPLRGRKGQLWEGGVRVPMALRWPNRIKPGSVETTNVVSRDLVATFLEAAGQTINPEWKLDARSLLPLFKGQKQTFQDRPLYWRKGDQSGFAVRSENWKLVRLKENGQFADYLYNLELDKSESNNIAASNQQVVAELRKKIESWNSTLVTPKWGPGSPDYRPRSRNRKQRLR